MPEGSSRNSTSPRSRSPPRVRRRRRRLWRRARSSGRHGGRRAFLDDFLVAPLQRALALAERDDVPCMSPKTCTSMWRGPAGISRLDRVVPEGRRRFAPAGGDGFGKRSGVAHDAHAFASASRRCFHDDWERKRARDGGDAATRPAAAPIRDLPSSPAPLEPPGHPPRSHLLPRGNLRPHRFHRLGRGPDPDHPGALDRPRKIRVLREKTVARMHGAAAVSRPPREGVESKGMTRVRARGRCARPRPRERHGAHRDPRRSTRPPPGGRPSGRSGSRVRRSRRDSRRARGRAAGASSRLLRGRLRRPGRLALLQEGARPSRPSAEARRSPRRWMAMFVASRSGIVATARARCFASAIASGPPSRIASRIIRVAAPSSFSGTTRCTRPACRASSGRDALPSDEPGTRTRLPDLVHEIGRDDGWNDSEPHLGRAEDRVLRGHDHVAHGDKAGPASEGGALDARHDRFRQLVKRTEKRRQLGRIAEVLLHREARDLLHPVDVGAGAERLARARELDDTGRRILASSRAARCKRATSSPSKAFRRAGRFRMRRAIRGSDARSRRMPDSLIASPVWIREGRGAP